MVDKCHGVENDDQPVEWPVPRTVCRIAAAWPNEGFVSLVHEAFTLPDLDRVEILHDLANTRSGAVPRRLGFIEVERRARRRAAVSSGESGIEVVWRPARHGTVGG